MARPSLPPSKQPLSSLEIALAFASIAGGVIALYLDRRHYLDGFAAGQLGSVSAAVFGIILAAAHGLTYRRVVTAILPMLGVQILGGRAGGLTAESLVAYPLIALGVLGFVMALRAPRTAKQAESTPVRLHTAHH